MKQSQSKALLLMNVGSPDDPSNSSVKKYLTEFLNDKRVVDLPFVLRKLLVNAIIIPFRVKKSTVLYRQLWTDKGSPLIYHSMDLKEKLQKKTDNQYDIFLGMRYGNPSYKTAIAQIKAKGYKEMIVLPLFPQFAMSTIETAIEAVKKEVKKQQCNINLRFVEPFYNHEAFIDAFAEQIKKHHPNQYDHIIFSYHGLPNRHIKKGHSNQKIKVCNYEVEDAHHSSYCYQAACFSTTRSLVKALNLNEVDYSVSFQSRLTKKWLSPFTDQLMLELLKKGKKKILVATPSFVTDCLETIIEIGDEYKTLFLQAGGEQLQLVESLNANKKWVDAIEKIVSED